MSERCPKGLHEMSSDNVYTQPGGYRECKQCRRIGDTARRRRRGQAERQPIGARIETHSRRNVETGCREWTGSKTRDGYGSVRVGPHTRLAHRVAYELAKGQVPAGMELDHVCHSRDLSCAGGPTCRHRSCVNPSHLEPVTHLENALRGASGRKTVCVRGHQLPLRTEGKAGRTCKPCRAEDARAYRRRKKAAS